MPQSQIGSWWHTHGTDLWYYKSFVKQADCRQGHSRWFRSCVLNLNGSFWGLKEIILDRILSVLHVSQQNISNVQNTFPNHSNDQNTFPNYLAYIAMIISITLKGIYSTDGKSEILSQNSRTEMRV